MLLLKRIFSCGTETGQAYLEAATESQHPHQGVAQPQAPPALTLVQALPGASLVSFGQWDQPQQPAISDQPSSPTSVDAVSPGTLSGRTQKSIPMTLSRKEMQEVLGQRLAAKREVEEQQQAQWAEEEQSQWRKQRTTSSKLTIQARELIAAHNQQTTSPMSPRKHRAPTRHRSASQVVPLPLLSKKSKGHSPLTLDTAFEQELHSATSQDGNGLASVTRHRRTRFSECGASDPTYVPQGVTKKDSATSGRTYGTAGPSPLGSPRVSNAWGMLHPASPQAHQLNHPTAKTSISGDSNSANHDTLRTTASTAQPPQGFTFRFASSPKYRHSEPGETDMPLHATNIMARRSGAIAPLPSSSSGGGGARPMSAHNSVVPLPPAAGQLISGALKHVHSSSPHEQPNTAAASSVHQVAGWVQSDVPSALSPADRIPKPPLPIRRRTQSECGGGDGPVGAPAGANQNTPASQGVPPVLVAPAAASNVIPSPSDGGLLVMKPMTLKDIAECIASGGEVQPVRVSVGGSPDRIAWTPTLLSQPSTPSGQTLSRTLDGTKAPSLDLWGSGQRYAAQMPRSSDALSVTTVTSKPTFNLKPDVASNGRRASDDGRSSRNSGLSTGQGSRRMSLLGDAGRTSRL